MYNRLLLPICLSFMVSSLSFGQFKYEREERIEQGELPKTAQDLLPLIDSLAQGIRYYRETDGTKESFEIKFKYHKTKYSVEFDNNGTLEDIEVLIRQSNVPQPTLLRIENDLRNDFIRFKLKKIQEQFSHPKGYTPTKTLQKVMDGTMEINAFEIIVAGKTKLGHERYEFLFDYHGNRIKKRKILSKGYDHIMF